MWWFNVEITSWRGTNWRNRWMRWSGGLHADHLTLRVHTDCKRVDYTLNVDAGKASWVSTPHLKRLYRNKFEEVETKYLGRSENLIKTKHSRFNAVQLFWYWYLPSWLRPKTAPDTCVLAVRQAAKAHGYTLLDTHHPDRLMESI